ncbi:MAG: aminotransferase class I/II-fold pyridoxal phosphate-dependent enzyme, partial [Verrucomicrobia bacterium]|nr:aminotransferase class I/II-fold pyridoxal phosphate-dependent enzyme [Verrucomicrobiota bacterium]
SREFLARVRAASHYFDGSSAPAAPVAGASAKALEMVSAEPQLRDRLRTNVRQLRDGLRRLGLAVPDGDTAQTGVGIGDAAHMRRIHGALKARGILVPYFGAYSGLPPEGMLRIAVFATHTREQVDQLLSALRDVL